MTDPERWLAENTFHCERHNAKLQTSSCERYQAIEPDRCRGCARAGGVVPLEKAVRKQLRRHKVEPAVKLGVCVKCKRTRKIKAKGECASCNNAKYSVANNERQKEYRKLAKEALAYKAAATMPTVVINITVTDAAELLDFVSRLKPLVGGAA